MKRLVIVVEGDTEKEFVNRVLTPYFYSKGMDNVACFKIKHTKGGLTKYLHLKSDLINCVNERDVILTTLIDFYALPKDFPKYEASLGIVNKADKLTFLEQAIKENIESELGGYFPDLIPYIQLHEFEAFVFSTIDGVSQLFENKEADFEKIKNIIDSYPNPEDINDDPKTAPSKRLIKLIKGYNKVIDGILIIEEIGIEPILEKCPRFRNWVNTILNKALE